jgi:hypothetical protein
VAGGVQGFGAEFVKEYVQKTGFDGAFNVGEFWTDLKYALLFQVAVLLLNGLPATPNICIPFVCCATIAMRWADTACCTDLLLVPPQLGLRWPGVRPEWPAADAGGLDQGL